MRHDPIASFSLGLIKTLADRPEQRIHGSPVNAILRDADADTVQVGS